MRMNLGLDLEEYTNCWIKKTDQSQRFLAKGIRPKLNYGNFSMSHWAVLPDYKGVQHILGVSSVISNKKFTTNYDLKYRFKRNLFPSYNIDLLGLATLGTTEQSLAITLSKGFENGMNLSQTTQFSNSNIFLSNILLSKKFDNELTCYSQLSFEDETNLLTGLNKEWKDTGFKIDSALALYSDKIRISNSISKKIEKKIESFVQLNSYVSAGQVFPQLNIGYEYHASSTSKFSLSSLFAASSVGLEVRYSRLKFKMGLPITLSSTFEAKTTLLSLLITGVSLYFTYLYEKLRKKSKRYIAKLEKKNSARISDGKKELAEIIGVLYPESTKIVLNEISKKGIVVLKAFYGNSEQIKKIYLEELKNSSYRNCFRCERLANELLNENLEETERIQEEDKSEILDVRVIVQSLVENSTLKLPLDEFKNIKGVFNPSLEEESPPCLMLKIFMNNKIFLQLLEKSSSKFELNLDYDIHLQNQNIVQEGFSLSGWLKSFNL